MSNPERNPRRVLARHGFSPKASWGQNFLVDARVVERIADALGAGADDTVVEIGAGTGALTHALANRAGRVVAVERDPDMVRVLTEELAGRPSVTIVAADALEVDFAALVPAGRILVAGNLPYQITSGLLFKIAEADRRVAHAVVMIQREVAERCAAPPGGKVYGRLSVMLQQAAEVKTLFSVAPGAFFPRPQVTSAVVRIAPRAVPLAPVGHPAMFDSLVRTAFAARRKMLRRALAVFGDEAAQAALRASGIEGTRRAETLAVADFGRLADALTAAGAQPREIEGA